ncbi:hypothetical protein evm_005200 [Chilo suppressalis]|nr:hypothetical protein evm_005200 [Chilo suppressalis]
MLRFKFLATDKGIREIACLAAAAGSPYPNRSFSNTARYPFCGTLVEDDYVRLMRSPARHHQTQQCWTYSVQCSTIANPASSKPSCNLAGVII